MDADVLAEVRRLTAPEEGALAAARDRLPAGVAPPSPETGALLRWAAATCGAHHAVEVGSAGGVSGLWLLDGLGDRGVLTSIEPDPHTHGLTVAAFEEAGATARVRCILGEPDTVLPRLTDGGYDLVVLQTGPVETTMLVHARRLLRAGGLLAVRGVLRPGEHADEQARVVESLTDDAQFDSVVLPFDDGIAVATRRPDEPGQPEEPTTAEAPSTPR